MGALARDQSELSDKQVLQEVERSDFSESNWDETLGYSENLFARDRYEQDDKEADKIYESIDEHMDGRHKRRREQQMLEDQKKTRNDRPKIGDQFADLKRDLSTVTAEEWDAIPDVGDHSLKLKQKRTKESFVPLPDHIIEAASHRTGMLQHSIDPSLAMAGGFDTVSSGFQTVAGLAESRGSSLSSKLDKMSDSVSGQTVVDPKGYLTDLNSLKIASEADVGDFKKARMLLSSVTSTNPKHGPGWIAAARVEEVAGKLVQARKIIAQGCEACPESEDVWLESARLNTTENAKTILASAVKNLPTSVKIWISAADLEEQDAKKKIVLRRALEFVPNSVKLWKTAIQLEDVSDARIMLARAVECVPHAVDMWLALAKIETHENARKVLNQAREAIPTEPLTWITAAKLEEAHGNAHMVGRIIEKMLSSLVQFKVTIDRYAWLKEAEAAEAAGAVVTAGAIVKHTIHIGVDEEDRKPTWSEDAEACLNHDPPAKETARAIYAHALSFFPKDRNLWLSASMLEKDHGTPESLERILKSGVISCPHAEVLWLMGAKEKWVTMGNVQGARDILTEAFEANPGSEQIWLAAVKLEWENNELQRARALLSKARDQASSERVWMKAALLERELGDVTEELALIDEAVRRYPEFAKFYMMAGQTCDEVLNDVNRAREYYQRGLKSCPTSAALWRLVIRLEDRVRGPNKARSMTELARLKLPLNPEIWIESIRLERRAGNEKLAENLMAKALQECPLSGIIWAEDITTCAKTAQRSKSVDALKKCDNDPHVVTAVARLFEKDRKIPKARKWFDRAVGLSPMLGDAWAYFYAFELRQQESGATGEGADDEEEGSSSSSSSSSSAGRASSAEEILRRCAATKPTQGEVWCSVAKKTANRRLDSGSILKKVVEQLFSSSSSSSATSSSSAEGNSSMKVE